MRACARPLFPSLYIHANAHAKKRKGSVIDKDAHVSAKHAQVSASRRASFVKIFKIKRFVSIRKTDAKERGICIGATYLYIPRSDLYIHIYT